MKLAYGNRKPTLGPRVFVAPNAAVIGDVTIGADSGVWFSAVIRGDFGPIRIGERTSIQDGAVIHVTHTRSGDLYETHIGSDCVIGHGAVAEGCVIEDGCLIGMNAVVLPRSRIGAGSLVAAGSVVTEGRNIPPYSLVAGAPAKIKRSFDGPSAEQAWAAREYTALKDDYLDNAGLGAE